MRFSPDCSHKSPTGSADPFCAVRLVLTQPLPKECRDLFHSSLAAEAPGGHRGLVESQACYQAMPNPFSGGDMHACGPSWG